MSYNFKKIIDLELVNEVPEGANVLIETDGATKRLPSTAIKSDDSYSKEESDAKYLTKDHEQMQADFNENDVTSKAHVLNRTHYTEDNGTVHKLDQKYLPIKTAIIKDSEYDNALAGVQQTESAIEITYSCINMTFEEAYQTMASGQPLGTLCMISGEGAMNVPGMLAFTGAVFGVPCIIINTGMSSTTLFWTADGIFTNPPSSGEES